MKKSALSTSSGLALALEPRMMFDGAAVSTAAEVAAQAEPVAQAANSADAPGVSATGNDPAVSIDEHGTAAADVDLFSGVSVIPDSNNEDLSTLVITVDTYGDGHALVIDGTVIALTPTSGFGSTSNEYTYSVEVTGGKTNITIYLDNGLNYSPAAVASLIDGISYRVVDGSKVAGGSINVTLTSLSDFGGDTAELNISSAIAVNSSFNIAPDLSNKDELTLSETVYGTDLGSAVDVAYSSNGKYAYAADSSGHISVFSVGSGGQLTEIQSLSGVADLGSASGLALNEARSTLYAVNGGKLVVLDVRSDGTLEYKQTINLQAQAYEIHVSHDGKQVYQNSQYNGMYVYNVDDSGLLTYDGGHFDEGGVGRQTTVTTSGEYLFATGSGSMWVYSRNLATGELSLISQLSTGVSGVATAMRASADGTKVFVAYGDKIVTYAFSSGQLTKLGETSATGITDMEISSDGNRVYISTSSGSVHIYTVDASGSLSLTGQAAGLEGAAALSLDSDGNVLVGGKNIALLVAHKTGLYGSEISFADGLTISDANYDVLNSGLGNYGGAKITVERAGGANPEDIFAFASSNGYTLNGTTVQDSEGKTLATVTNAGGKLTVAFADGVTKGQANAILHQWRYSNNTVAEGGTAVILKIVANDGKADSEAITVALRLGVNTAPELTTNPVSQGSYTSSGVEVNLFTNTAVNAGEAGQTLAELQFSISGLSGVAAGEYIKLDGSTIALNANASGTTSGGYVYTYTISGGVGTLSITQASGMSASGLAALVNGLKYGYSGSDGVAGTRTFTVTHIKDTGGTDNSGQDSKVLDVASTLTLAVNSAPVLDIDSGNTDSAVFYNDGKLAGFNDYVNEIDISADGKTVVVCGTSGGNGGGSGTLYVFARDAATGELTLVQTFSLGASGLNVDGLTSFTSSVISQDGKTLYVAACEVQDGSWGAVNYPSTSAAILLFSRDTATGEFVFKGVQAQQGVDGVDGLGKVISELVLSDDGKFLYTANGLLMNHNSASQSAIAVFSVDAADGYLDYVSMHSGGNAASGIYNPSNIVLSSDGNYAYVSNASGNCIGIFARNSATGDLTYIVTVNEAYINADSDGSAWVSGSLSTLQDIVITPDGNFVYVSAAVNGGNKISVFSRDADTGALHFVESFVVTGFTFVRELVVSADNSTLYVGGYGASSIQLYSINPNTGKLNLSSTLALSGQAGHIVVSPDGKNIYGGTYNISSGLQIASAMPVIAFDGSEVVIGSGITISDPDYDTAGNYAGTTVTIERSAGANTADDFGFTDSTSLKLNGGKILYNNVEVATFTVTDGKLILAFAGSVAGEVANQVLHQITYKGSTTLARTDFTVTVTDAPGKSASGKFAVMYEGPNSAPVLGNAAYTVGSGDVDTAYSVRLPADLFTDADNDKLAWSVSGLPDGLSFNADTRVISGTPTASGLYTVTIKVTEPDGLEASHTVKIRISSPTDPSLSADAVGGSYPINAGGTPTGNDVDLFANVSITKDTSDQSLSKLVVTVDTYGAEHSLGINGQVVSLTAKDFTQIGDYGYSVAIQGGKAIITIDLYEKGDDLAAVQNLIDSMAYRALDGTKIQSGVIGVTLTSLSDIGDSATGGAEDVTRLDITAKVTVASEFNMPPDVVDKGSLDLAQIIYGTGLSDVREVAWSADGKYAYAADSNGNLCVFEVGDNGKLKEIQSLAGVPDLDGFTDMAVNDTASALYVMSGDKIVVLKIGADGKLGDAQSVDVSILKTPEWNPDGYEASTQGLKLVVSDDGAQVYVTTSYEGLYIFKVDDASALIAIQYLDDNTNVTSVYSRGGYVFVAAGGFESTITVYKRATDGTLGIVDSVAIDMWNWSPDFKFEASADGSTLFAGYISDGDSKVFVYSFAEGRLTLLSEASMPDLASMQVSEDGKTFYAGFSDGTLRIYSVDTGGALTLTRTITGLDGASSLSLSGDGDILVGGQGIALLSATRMGLYGEDISFADGITLSDANLDLLNNGTGKYDGASVTVQREGTASNDDVFSFKEGGGYTLNGSDIMKNGEKVATFSSSGGVLTLTFVGEVTKADANAILQQCRYRNQSASASENAVSLTLIASDGEKSSTPLSITLLLGTNTAPELTTTPKNNGTYTTVGGEVQVFTKTSVDAGETGQGIAELHMSVSGISGSAAGEYIKVDGVTISLGSNASGTTASGYTYSYTVSGGTGTLTIGHASGMSVKAVAALVDGIVYGTTSADAASGTRTFTITHIKDNGGTAGGGADSADLSIASTVNVAINLPPELDAGNNDPDSGYYYSDGTLQGYNGYVTDIIVSEDGKTVIVSGNSDSNNNGSSSLMVYARDVQTGKLSLLQTFTQGVSDNPATATIEVNGLNQISTMTMSADGGRLYVAGYAANGSASAYSITLFTRNADTGLLTAVGIVASQGVSGVNGLDAAVSSIALSADGKSLYAVNGTTAIHGTTGQSDLTTFSVKADGTLTYVGVYTGGSGTPAVYNPSGLIISSDGKNVYVANASGSSIGVFSRNTDTGALTYMGVINKTTIDADSNSGSQPGETRYLESLQDIVITPDGGFVYVASGTMGLVSVFSRDPASGNLTYVQSFNAGSLSGIMLRDLAVSSDGKYLYVGTYGSSNLLVCSIDEDSGVLTLSSILAVTGTGGSAHLAVSSDGLSLYSGTYSFFPGVSAGTAMPGVKYSGSEVLIGKDMTISDPDFDKTGDYSGLSISFERGSGASFDDVFGFQAANNLTLDSGKILLSGVEVATFTVTDGKLMITFSAQAGVNGTVVNNVLHQVTYKNTSNTFTSLTITVGDGEKSVSSSIALVESNAAPSLKASPSGGTYAFDESSTPPAESAKLFDNVKIGLGDDNEALKDLVVTVDKSGSAHTIVIDGTAVALTNNNSLVTSNGYSCVVSVVEGKATITISLNGASVDAVKTLVEGMRYSRSAENLVRESVTVTLASLSDTTDTTTRNISSVVNVYVPNRAPVIADPAYTLGEKATADKGTAYSVTLPESLFSDPDGDSLTWSVMVKLSGGTEFVSLAEAGLSFNATTRIISGTPSLSGTLTFAVSVTDAASDAPKTATHEVTLVVANLPPAFVDGTTLPPLPKGATGSVDLNDLVNNPADGDTLTWALTGGTSLPAGLTLNADGTISGMSTTSGTYTFEVTVTDSDSANPGSATKTITLTVENSAPAFNGADYAGYQLPQAVEGAAYSPIVLPADMFVDINGDALIWSISGLPEGLSFDPVTRAISGTPAEVNATGAVTITITVTDPDGASASHNLTLTVRDNTAPVPSDVPLAPAREGAPYTLRLNDVFTDADGDALTYSVTSLPEGLAFGPATGTITGRPLVTGSNSITVTATDAYGKSVSHTFELTVEANGLPAASDVSFTPPQATEGENYSLTLPENLFTDPDGDNLSLSVSGLPEGLSFDPATGRISGTPSGSGTFTIVITATDPSLASASRTVTLVVEAAPVTVLPPASENTVIPVIAEYSVDGGGSLAPGSGVTAATEPSGIFDEEWQSSAVMSDVAHVWATVDAMWNEDARRQGYGDTRARESRADTHADASAAQKIMPGQVSSNWGYDVAGNRYLAALPQAAHRAINGEISGYTLVYADSGKDASGEFRFDASAWALVSPGFKAPGHVRLLLVVTTVDGKTVRIPVEVKSQTHALGIPAAPAVTGTADRAPVVTSVVASAATVAAEMAGSGATALPLAGQREAGGGTVESGVQGHTALFGVSQADTASAISESFRFSVEAAGQTAEAIGKPALGSLLRMSLDNSLADKSAASSRDAVRAAPEVLSA
ncbi:beta-propeller fold lactonase family protein [Desulfovibrio intestinalis]|uniref:6-phosphogluconolactonase (Cycloisomerase 2 family) n=1 Tax=Desulfovibrio intestinalis TaxID=58621 RepID=A0A7W8BY79_9BACT|nr:beta-propeller fold lactonase family protein [Desulfovibrio intestinalis]MBB5142132.1 6-phosphogluconolactonase (cycloisomerase 2 family) [Desulfovibrio intestinalis]